LFWAYMMFTLTLPMCGRVPARGGVVPPRNV
jgi:hypothetical protein